MTEVKENAILSQTVLDAQVGVLGCMMLDEQVAGMALSRVSDTDFVLKPYRTIFKAIQNLFRDGLPTDAISVREKLGGSIDGPWTQTLKSILDNVPTAANADGYIRLLKESSMLYQLRNLGESLSSADTLDSAKEILDKAMQLQVGRPGIHALTFEDGYNQFFDRHGTGTAVEYLQWAIVQLNEVVQAELGNIVVIGAYPGDGKTAFALQCAAKFGQKHRVGYFSFESKAERLYDRHVSRTALISSKSIASNSLSEKDFSEILALKNTIAGPDVTIIDAAGMTALDIIAYSQANHYDVVIVDYLQQVELSGGSRLKDVERVTAVSHELQKFAVRTNTAVIELSQLSRPDRIKIQLKGEDGKKTVKSIQPPPSMSDLRSSGQIEQDADIILMMWREDYDVKDSPRIIRVEKNRNGEAKDMVRCKFDGDHQAFVRIEPRREPYSGWHTTKREKDPQTTFWADGPAWKETTGPTPFDEEEPLPC